MKVHYLFLVFALGFAPNSYSSEIKVKLGPMGSGRFLTPCTIDGRIFDCFVDTGSQFSLVNNDAVFQNYPSAGRLKYAGAGGSPKEADKILIQNFTLDKVIVQNVEMGRFDPKEGWSQRLGMDILQKYRVRINFKINTMTVGATRSCAQKLFPLIMKEKGIPALKMTVDDSKVTAIFDTGAALTVIEEDLIKAKPDLFRYLQDVNGADSTNTGIRMKLYLAKELNIGKTSFKNILVLSMDFSQMKAYFGNDVRAIIGYNQFSQKNWYFDFPENLFRIY